MCHAEPEDEKTASIPISSVFADAQAEAGIGPSPVAEFGLMDCTYVLPSSGKTIAQRFGLNLQKRPTIFVSGPAIEDSKPKQIPSKNMKTGHMLVKLLKQMLEPHAAKINNNKELKSKCLNKDYCGLLLKGGKPEQYVKDAVKNLLTSYPQVQFASVDSNLLYLTNLEAEYMPEYEPGTHRFVLFKKISGGLSVSEDDKEKEGRIITSILPLSESDPLSFGSIKKIVDKGLKQKSNAMKKIPSLPQVKTRTKKLEEAEKKKRERAKNQSQRKKEQQRSTPTGQFAANDGSKEGRKAERERRRQEHRKNNPDFREKTPEEKAEMERKRRERMEDESKKWNVAEEDAPPEGEYAEDGGANDMFMDEETYVEYEDVDDGSTDEDDEDILDLD